MATRKGPQGGERRAPVHGEPYLVPATADAGGKKKAAKQRWSATACASPIARATLVDTGLAVQVEVADEEMAPATLILPFRAAAMPGVDALSMRLFRVDDRKKQVRPVWSSGVNLAMGFVWAKIRRPGSYVAVALPRDRLLQAVLQVMAEQRRYADPDDADLQRQITDHALALFRDADPADLQWLRQALTVAEAQQHNRPIAFHELRLGQGGHYLPFDLPGGEGLDGFRKQLDKLRAPLDGFPEEQLFFRPELGRGMPMPMFGPGGGFPNPDGDLPDGGLPNGGLPTRWPDGWEPGDDICPPWPWWKRWPWPIPIPWPRPIWPLPRPRLPICWLPSRNWWMYHHDASHTGVASGCCDITTTNVSSLVRATPTTLEGDVVSIPSVVNGYAYVGTYNRPSGPDADGDNPGGKLYKIRVSDGAIVATFKVPRRSPSYAQGIGGSPAVVGGRVYFTGVPGWVFCCRATDLGLLWQIDLRNADPARRQPVNNNLDGSMPADSWSSPLVVNDRVYVGSGEGEGARTYGFIYCLDAATGDVIWLFCTNKFTNINAAGSDNAPNVIPREVAFADPLPSWAGPRIAGRDGTFTLAANPPETGSSVWSSCAYCATTDRIYVGTGNSQYRIIGGQWRDTDQPDERYGSGMLALDATTGAFAGFHQSARADSYRPDDGDVDVCGSPTVFERDGVMVVGYGSKNGSYFVVRADDVTVEVAKRQLLPKDAVSGAAIPGVDPAPDNAGENQWGIYGTAAVDVVHGGLYVGLGGRGDIHFQTTPFVRAMDLTRTDLGERWPSAIETVGGNQVRRYLNGRATTPGGPGLYSRNEVSISSPAVANDVVFVTTNAGAIYGFDATTGNICWSDPGLGTPTQWWQHCLGPAVYGNWVVLGWKNQLFRFRLP